MLSGMQCQVTLPKPYPHLALRADQHPRHGRFLVYVISDTGLNDIAGGMYGLYQRRRTLRP